MIPRIIHYCWFGRGKKPKIVKKCIHSWEDRCPNYEIIEWTEDNYDMESTPQYVKDAYKEKKWAFVSDYVRFDVLVKYGGIYLDTDEELLDSLDAFLHHSAFTGTEDGTLISAGLMGCIKGYSLFSDFRDSYKRLSFYNTDRSQNLTTVVDMLTKWCEEKGYQPGNKYQEVSGLTIYPSEYFYPLSNADRVMRKTRNTVAIHWFAGSWVPVDRKKEKKKRQFKNRIKPYIVSVIGNDMFDSLKRIFHYEADD